MDDDPDGIAKAGADCDGIQWRDKLVRIVILKVWIHIFRHNGKAQRDFLWLARGLKLPAGEAVIQKLVTTDQRTIGIGLPAHDRKPGRLGFAQKEPDILLKIKLDLQIDLIRLRLVAGDKASAAQRALSASTSRS